MMYTVILGGSKGCGSQSLECFMSVDLCLFSWLQPKNNWKLYEQLLGSSATWKLYLKYSLVFIDLVTAAEQWSTPRYPSTGEIWFSSDCSGYPFLRTINFVFWEHICHFMAGAPWELRWAVSNDNTLPFPHLWLWSHYAMPCSGNPGVRWIILSLRWARLCGASPPKRGKRSQVLSVPGLGFFYLRAKSCCIHGW